MRSPPSPSAHLAGFGLLWASGFPTLRAGGSRREDVSAQAGLWTWDLHQPRGQKRRSSALGVAGQRTQAGWPGRGDGLGDPARAGLRRQTQSARLRYPATSVPGTEQLPARAVLRFPRPGPLPAPDPRSSRAARNLRCGARFRPAPFPGRRRPSRPRAPAPAFPRRRRPELPGFPAPPPPALAREARAARDLGPRSSGPERPLHGYMGRDGGRSRAGPAVIWVGVGPGPATAGTEGQGQRGCWGSAEAEPGTARGGVGK